MCILQLDDSFKNESEGNHLQFGPHVLISDASLDKSDVDGLLSVDGVKTH